MGPWFRATTWCLPSSPECLPSLNNHTILRPRPPAPDGLTSERLRAETLQGQARAGGVVGPRPAATSEYFAGAARKLGCALASGLHPAPQILEGGDGVTDGLPVEQPRGPAKQAQQPQPLVHLAGGGCRAKPVWPKPTGTPRRPFCKPSTRRRAPVRKHPTFWPSTATASYRASPCSQHASASRLRARGSTARPEALEGEDSGGKETAGVMPSAQACLFVCRAGGLR